MKGKAIFQLILFLVFNPLGNIAYPNPNNLNINYFWMHMKINLNLFIGVVNLLHVIGLGG